MEDYSNHYRLLITPNNSNSPPSSTTHVKLTTSTTEIKERGNSETLQDYPQEITWLFFRDNKWIPFQSNNHFKIEQAFTLGGNIFIMCVSVCV
jgi:hypothetical protein